MIKHNIAFWQIIPDLSKNCIWYIQFWLLDKQPLWSAGENLKSNLTSVLWASQKQNLLALKMY